MATKQKKDKKEKAHSPIGASSMHRWAACPGSIALIEKLADELGVKPIESEYAKEGTLAHELAEHLLRARLGGEKINMHFVDSCPPGMLEAVNQYVDLVCNYWAKEYSRALVEHKFDLSPHFAHLGIDGVYGTADFVAYCDKEKKLLVADYKHGAGIAVDVINNDQLLYYAAGAALTLNLPVRSVELVIVQPRALHHESGQTVRTWSIFGYELAEFVLFLEQRLLATKQKDAKLAHGSHCRFCPAKPHCPQLLKSFTDLAIEDFSATPIEGAGAESVADVAMATPKTDYDDKWLGI